MFEKRSITTKNRNPDGKVFFNNPQYFFGGGDLIEFTFRQTKKLELKELFQNEGYV